MMVERPRMAVAALRGGAGKTVVSLGMMAAFRAAGAVVAPFKKGPDFIDPGWLGYAAGRDCRNLDAFMMSDTQIVHSFLAHSQGADISIVEGNRGIYDGLDIHGCCSTAELGKLLSTPVLLIVDVTMATRTVAAVVKGCQVFDPEVAVAGVLLNRVGGRRQENLIRNAVKEYCGLPVLGAIPRFKTESFPERHMGLIPHQETDQADQAIGWARTVVEDHVDLDAVREIARRAPLLQGTAGPEDETAIREGKGPGVRIGFIRDRSFWFYYPENLEALRRQGAELMELDALNDPAFPEMDALYIGGGFPETQAEPLAANRSFREGLRAAVEAGMPVYAECGGLMYLGEELVVGERRFPMVGALPLTLELHQRPQGHGYTLLEAAAENPYYPLGEQIKGHEFHYSRAVLKRDDVRFAFKVHRGHGVDGRRDGLCRRNLLATYTHIHAAGCPAWARRFAAVAEAYAKK